MADDNKKKQELHIAVFPWLAFGHMIPFLELSRLLAEKGHTVSFISTPRNIQRLPKIPRRLSHVLHFVSIPLPADDNLPDGAEATSDLPQHLVPYLKHAHDGLEPELTRFLENRRPDWIIYDIAPHWLPPIAARLGVSRLFFSLFMAALGGFFSSDDWGSRTSPQDFTKSISFPSSSSTSSSSSSSIAFRLHEAKRFLHPMTSAPPHLISDFTRTSTATAGCEATAIRSCPEFEPEWLDRMIQRSKKPILPLGLLPPSSSHDCDDDSEEETTSSATWIRISEWLNKQKKATTVYVALGSEVALTKEETAELALGLESSGIPFLWALKEQFHHLLPDGFGLRIQGSESGIICSTWVPQVKILGHESVGGFLTHCGFNSAIEGLHFGLPLIMLPYQADQPIVARVLAGKKLGVEIPRAEEDGFYSSNSVAETVRMVMLDDEQGKVYRDRAEAARKEVFANTEIHDRHFTDFVSFLQQHRRRTTTTTTTSGGDAAN